MDAGVLPGREEVGECPDQLRPFAWLGAAKGDSEGYEFRKGVQGKAAESEYGVGRDHRSLRQQVGRARPWNDLAR
ncbi:hypothetical protein GCM10010172_16300 [Paractinoplanes ferrugineus]|uniref:Uncharacterized protein n=1 Tax=Paractinoplanes ferrugineus TaxID=113564 RepID=A0A919J0J7_9ACTN|nr:hypothetical protein Afe05nite_20340 [Actinoplanes ferrugineus]